MSKVGNKYIIEIDEELIGFKNNLYKIKGFNSLVFDDTGLDKLVKYNNLAVPIQRDMLIKARKDGYNEGYNKGAEAQLRACEKLINDLIAIGNDTDFLKNIYGGLSFWQVLDKYDLKDVFKLHKQYNNTKVQTGQAQPKVPHTLCVGDVVKVPGCEKAIITMISGNRCHVVGKNFKGDLDLFLVKFLGEHKELF